MLLRQLHRPLLRSVAAAQWRPAAFSSASPFHQDDSRPSIINSADKADDIGYDGQEPQQLDEQFQDRPKPSLFARLFPEDARKKAQANPEGTSDADVVRNTWASQLAAAAAADNDDEPPRLAVPEELRDDAEEILAQLRAERSSPAFRAQSMLILSAASKNLLESDFLRVGAKGKLVDGWVGGILKVIQARNPDTLEPQGHYFILFDTNESATAYRDRVEHLWSLGKAHVPGAHHGRLHRRQQLALPAGLRRTEQGEDVAALIRSFTLVPPSQRRHVLQTSRLGPERIVEAYLAGGFVDRLAARAGSASLVLVRLDGGRLHLDALRRAIADDGVRRNLPWRIVGDPSRGGDASILPFGKSITKANDPAAPPPAAAARSKGVNSGDGDGHSSSTEGEGKGEEGEEEEEEEDKSKQYPRFIIPFMDKPEAYRFVQHWHRRELRISMGGERFNEPTWEETRIINATILQ